MNDFIREPNFGWDYPPGVSESDIPGNRPIDELWDHVIDNWCNDTECRCYQVCKLVMKGNECDCPRLIHKVGATQEHPNPDQEWDERGIYD